MSRMFNKAAISIATVFLMAGTAKAACTVSPSHIVLIQGQTTNLTVTCDAGERFSSIDWVRDATSASGGLGFPVSITEPGPFGYRTYDKLGAGTYGYRMVGTNSPGPGTTDSTVAQVVVIAKPVQIVNGACGSSKGQLLHDAPASNLCAAGTASGVVTAADSFSWTCTGSDAGTTSCLAPRGYNVAASASSGQISPNGTSLVAYRATPTFTFFPPQGTGPVVSGTCGGVWSTSNTAYTTQPVTGDCTVAVAFTQLTGASCGADNGTVPKTATPTALCAMGTPGGVTTTAATYSWTCTGAGTPTPTANCQAPHGYVVAGSAGTGGSISQPGAVGYNSRATLTVTPNAGYVVTSATGCGGSLSGSTFTTGPVTQNCTVAATFASGNPTDDPGSGLWSPPGYPNLLVANQMAVNGAGSMNYIPGCINYEPTPSSSSGGCALNDSYFGALAGGGTTTFQFLPGNIMSIRVTGKDDGFPDNGFFQLRGPTGDNIGSSVSLWVVSDPRTSYANTPETCKGTATNQINVSTASSMCPLTPGQRYYVNVMVNDAAHCGISGQCRMQLIESTDSF